MKWWATIFMVFSKETGYVDYDGYTTRRVGGKIGLKLLFFGRRHVLNKEKYSRNNKIRGLNLNTPLRQFSWALI